MSSFIETVRSRITNPEHRKFIKYSAVSVVAVVITFVTQLVCYGIFGIQAEWSAIIASSVAALPSYYLNRMWVWGKSTKSHLMKEVVPFWVMFVIGLGFATLASSIAGDWAKDVDNEHLRSLMVASASIVSYGLLWVIKYVIMNKILFAHREDQLEPALDGRSGLPT